MILKPRPKKDDTEINKWWPNGRYTKQKAGKTYYRVYETDTDWFGDVMSFEQDPKEFEGPLVSLTLFCSLKK